MENPSTWGKAEKVIQQTLVDYGKSQSGDTRYGPSLARTIADALRDADLLVVDPPDTADLDKMLSQLKAEAEKAPLLVGWSDMFNVESRTCFEHKFHYCSTCAREVKAGWHTHPRNGRHFCNHCSQDVAYVGSGGKSMCGCTPQVQNTPEWQAE